MGHIQVNIWTGARGPGVRRTQWGRYIVLCSGTLSQAGIVGIKGKVFAAEGATNLI